MTVSPDCATGQDIRSSYEVAYMHASSSGSSVTTCVVSETDCNNGTCRHELQNQTADSRCQPPMPQINGENMTVTVTARNVVGRSNSYVSGNISELSMPY